jgi:hypothetical protein
MKRMMSKSAISRLVASLFFVTALLLVLLGYTVPSRTVAPRSPQPALTPWVYVPFLRRDAPPAPPAIRIIDIHYGGVLPKAFEHVDIENYGEGAEDMTGWKLKKENGSEVYTFPRFVLQPGRTVEVYSTCGINSASRLYWCHRDHNFPIWGYGDVACLYEADGTRLHCFTAGS